MQVQAKAELTNVAMDATQGAGGNPEHRDAAVKSAVEAATPAMAEQKHQETEAEKLEAQGGKNSADAPQQEVLQAKVAAAKDMASTAEQEAKDSVKTPGSVS